MTGPHVTSIRVPAMAWLEWNPGDDDFPRWSEARNVVGTTVRWTDPQVLYDRRTGNVPSIAGRGADTVMAWKGGGSDKHIWFSRLQRLPDADPVGTQYVWGSQAPAGNGAFQTSDFPALIQYHGRMFMFWKATAATIADDHLAPMRWSELRGDTWVQPGDGPPFTAAWPIDGIRTEDGVAVAEHQGKLYVAWRHVSSGDILLRIYDGTSWQSHSIPFADGRVTSKVPALVSDGTHLYMAWRNVPDDHISWSTMEGQPQVLDDRRTAGSPALGLTDRGIVMVWVGGSGNTLWWSQFRNGQWSGQQPFTDRHMNLDLRVSLA
ncbi:MAG: hypothetical protein ACRDTH_05725 [Pseudonocardiaceae bacterium]